MVRSITYTQGSETRRRMRKMRPKEGGSPNAVGRDVEFYEDVRCTRGGDAVQLLCLGDVGTPLR